jgi:hypothetical protein
MVLYEVRGEFSRAGRIARVRRYGNSRSQSLEITPADFLNCSLRAMKNKMLSTDDFALCLAAAAFCFPNFELDFQIDSREHTVAANLLGVRS